MKKLIAAAFIAVFAVVAFSNQTKALVAPTEKGPKEMQDCAGWGTGDRGVCMASNNINCTPTPCG